MKQNRMIVLLLLCVLVPVFAVLGTEEANAGNPIGNDNPVAAAPTGTYTGNDSEGVQEFLGIPYASAQRWKPPTDVKTTTKDKIDASQWGPACPQPYNDVEVASQGEMSENCLSLNIWTKNVKLKKKPVLVYIHGGGFMYGGSHDPMYEGDSFIRNLRTGEDAVFVSINYRTNLFGSIDLSELPGYTKEYDSSINLWMLDQIQALKWIHENIAAFGGDPGNVTLCGQSCGGVSITYLLAKPETHKYFQKAIIESGSPFNLLESKAKKQENAQIAFDLLGVDSMKELMELSDEVIKERALTEYFETVGEDAGVYPDGKIIPTDWWDRIRKGSAKDVKVMIGCMNGENDIDEYDHTKDAKLWSTSQEIWTNVITDNVNRRGEKHGTTVSGLLNPMKADGKPAFALDRFLATDKNKTKAMLDLYNAMCYVQGTEYEAEALSDYTDTYMYYWTYAPAAKNVVKYCEDNERVPKVSPYGRALNGMGIVFGLGNQDYGYLEITGDPAKLPKDISPRMQGAFYRFIKTGDPNSKKTPAWKKYNRKDRLTMVMGADWKLVKDPRKAQREAFNVRPQGEKPLKK